MFIVFKISFQGNMDLADVISSIENEKGPKSLFVYISKIIAFYKFEPCKILTSHCSKKVLRLMQNVTYANG